MEKLDVVVLGGGIIGMACARELAIRGWQVELVERGQPGREASRAAAGMLAPLVEDPEGDPIFEAGRASRDLWPQWAYALETESALMVDYDRSGTLIVTETHDNHLERLTAAAQKLGEDVRPLSGEELRRLVPDLDESIWGGLLLAGEHRVDNRRVCAALARTLVRRGVKIRHTHLVERVVIGESTVKIEGSDWDLEADRLLVCAGASSGRIQGLPELPIYPVRGQMMQLEGIDWPWRGVVRSAKHYAVRRDDHSLVIGATVEDAGFETHTTPDGQFELLDFCRRFLPGLGKRLLRASWAGLRPATADGLPVMGRLDDGPVWYATGHYRNGILLAPWTASTIASWMFGEEPEQRFVDAFSPGRFSDDG